MHILVREAQTDFKSDALHPLLQRIFSARGIEDEEALNKQLTALISFQDFLGMEKAVERLYQAIVQHESILVIGDFDADGATSTSLAVSAMKTLGATNVDFLVPNRFEFGYGLTPAIVDVAMTKKPDVLVTVDNGIASLEGVAHANQLGLDVIVTDHHLAGDELPKAYAIVNPNQPGCPFPSKSIAGVGVIFYVMVALRRFLIDKQFFEKEPPNMAQFLDLVALGTVADVVSLDKNNRILVSQGIARMRQGHVRPGIAALAKIAGRSLETLTASDLGFFIGPRLNAAGRLDDMSLGIHCLLADNKTDAENFAMELDTLNKARREIETEMKTQALQLINQCQDKVSHGAALPIGLCLTDPSWHQGVIGVLAGRIKEKFHRPVIIFADVDNNELKGSCRSVNGVNIRDVLAEIDTKHPGIIKKFGGHAMAAGLTIIKDKFEAFNDAFKNIVGQYLTEKDCEDVILSDGPLTPDLLTLAIAKLIQQAGPWGQHFPEPLFHNTFEIIEQRIVGKNHLKLTVVHPDGGGYLDAIAFNVNLAEWPNYRATHLQAAYRLDVNVFQNRERLQLMFERLVQH